MNTVKIVGCALGLSAILVGITGCTPKDVVLLQKGTQLELTGKYAEAAAKYAESAALGNAEAYKRLGDMVITHDFIGFTPENVNDFVTGHDKWLSDAQQAVAKAKDYFERAQMAGCTNMLHMSLDKLAACEKKIAETSAKVREAKEKERLRLEEERKKREEEERIAREQREEAERIAKAKQEEEERIANAKRVETERIAREDAERKAEEDRKRREAEEAAAKRRAEEEARRNSPEYCIENDIELTSAALREVIKEVTFYSRTGNEIFDRQETARHHERFMDKIITVSGRINKVQITAFTREVKCIVSVSGGTISARFDGMSRDEAAGFRVGQSIRLRGRISNRPVLSTFAMDQCMIR